MFILVKVVSSSQNNKSEEKAFFKQLKENKSQCEESFISETKGIKTKGKGKSILKEIHGCCDRNKNRNSLLNRSGAAAKCFDESKGYK